MANENEQFDQQVHDALDRIELSEEAQDRMLANLLAARERTQEREAPSSEVPEKGERETKPDDAGAAEAKVIPVAPRRMPWLRWLPLAAVLVMAVVVVRVTSLGGKATNEQAVSVAAEDSASAPEESAKTVGEGSGEAAEDPVATSEMMALDAAADGAAEYESGWPAGLVEVYPRITLEDGTTLTALRDAEFVDEVDSERVGELVAAGTATPFDSAESVPCEVYRLVNEDDAYAVRYEGEQTYWHCTPVE